MRKKHSKVSQKCPTVQKNCYALEPILEHCEAPSEKPCRVVESPGRPTQSKKAATPMRILLTFRDRYVKLMNDMAWGANQAGMLTFYPCPGYDYPGTKLQEKEKQA